ncbi:hypothetical protein Leryth_005334 [Lithospermum erythrorhizon]|nr:hypothetical protein Leryth_005334 [Lithospermum erythrorhizon]
MTLFHFFNCAILTFGPHAVYYSATPLSEYDTLGTSMKTAAVYLVTALVKLVCLATFLNVPENDTFDPYQEILKASIGFIDFAGLYFALTQLTHRNISQNHKFQAVGLGWAFADAVLHRLLPLWVGARGLEFTWDYILQGLEANANLSISYGFNSTSQELYVKIGYFVLDVTILLALGVEYITCCTSVIDVAQEKQAQDLDSSYICMCSYCDDYAINHKLSEAKLGMGLAQSSGI